MISNAEEVLSLLEDCGKDCNTDLSEWMTNLPDHLTTIPINQLAIPGSHDSGAFWLDPDSPVCPDESCTIKILCKVFGCCAKKIVVRWSITQNLVITSQLQNGVRYLDMRTGYLQSEDDFFFAHGLYGHKIDDLLHEVASFLQAHPKEFVILDFNHFYSLTTTLHTRFAKSIASIYEGKLFAPSSKGVKSTLNDIRKLNKQVIVVYDNNDVLNQHSDFWSSDSIYSPWPNTSSVTTLINSLDHRFSTLREGSFNVFQAILTPQTKTVVGHVFSSLYKYLACKCDKAVSKWSTNVYNSKKHGVNIVICDFVSMDGCPADIIKLNNLITAEKW